MFRKAIRICTEVLHLYLETLILNPKWWGGGGGRGGRVKFMVMEGEMTLGW